MNALEVHNLRKEFTRRDGRGKRRVAALDGRRRSTIERGECVAILGQNGSGKSTLVRLLSTLLLPDGGTRDGLRPRRRSRTPARCGGSSTACRSRRASSRRCPRSRTSSYAARFYGMTPRADHATRIPEILDAGRLPRRSPRRADGEPLARDAAEGRARAGAADLAGPAAARRADDRPRPALEARGAGVHPRGARRRTTRRSCSARTTWPRPRASPTGSGSSTTASCSASSRRTSSRRATASRRSRRRSSPPPATRSRTRRRGRRGMQEVIA